MAEQALAQHKLLAMGKLEPQGDAKDGWPKSGNGKKIAEGRGTGRAADAKKSGMPKCDPEVAAFWDGGKEPAGIDGKIRVSEHIRSKPMKG